MLRELKYQVGTLLGRPRRERILDLLPKHSVGAEIGVFKGEFSGHLLRRVHPRELHLIDAWWKLFGEFYPDWGAYTDFGRLRTRDAFAQAEAVVRRYDRQGVASFHVADDIEYLSGVPDRYFDWVYLDSSHYYEHTRRELEVLDRKVKRDGLIAGDDWYEDGVYRAAREFCQATGWRLVRIDVFGQWCLAGPERAHPRG
jgi:hypothetical protein